MLGGIIMKEYKVYGLPVKDAAWLSYLEDDHQYVWGRRYKKAIARRKRTAKELT